MSFDLLNDAEVEKSFESIRRIASLLETAALARTQDKSGRLGPGLPNVAGGPDDDGLGLPASLSLPKGCGAETVTSLTHLGKTLKELADRLQRQTDEHFVAFFDHMKKKESSELEEICTKRKIIPQGYISHRQLVGQKFPVAGALEDAGSPVMGVDSVLPVVSDQKAILQEIFLPPTEIKGAGGQRNAPLARKLRERREAASTLQTFLFLVLETCISQCEATCAAVFLNGLPYKNPANKDSTRSASKAGDPDPIDRDAPPRFLHCVANLYGEGNFPNEISYATLNPLTAVVQTGVAVNLRNTECPELPTVDDKNRDLGTDDNVSESIKKNLTKVIKISSGIILPLGDFGCVIVANKRSTAIVNSFTVADEHIVWGAALFLTSVLTNYKRDLLLENPWFPSHIPPLRRFLTLPTVKEAQTEKNSSRLHIPPEVEASVVSNFGVLASNLMSFISEGRGANMPKRMTIVRTADPQTSHVVPVELLPRNRIQAATTEQVTEEEIFQGAAQYISNLESLWHKTLAENNAAHLVMQNYDKELESRNEEIRSLESKIRKLNTRIVQLERQRGRSIVG